MTPGFAERSATGRKPLLNATDKGGSTHGLARTPCGSAAAVDTAPSGPAAMHTRFVGIEVGLSSDGVSLGSLVP